MDLIDKKLLSYVKLHSDEENNLLHEINRYTHLHVLKPRMLSGHLQGRILSFISRMINPKIVIEIGTYTGYSALCLLEGIQDKGKLITIDINEEISEKVRKFFKKSTYNDKIEYLIGDAQNIIPKIDSGFDLVFIDADKENYSKYYDLVLPKLSKGGFILVDNVLWSGKVIDKKKDHLTELIDNFNKKIQKDNRVSNVILPIRDGIMLIQKK
mgnify:CR=1 FL=1